MDNKAFIQPQEGGNKPPRRSLFGDDKAREYPAAVTAAPMTPAYFRQVPLLFLLIFAWFSVEAMANLNRSLTSLYYIAQSGRYLLTRVAAEGGQPLWLIFSPLLLTLAYFAMLWGLVRQESWVKIVIGAWYVLVLLTLGYSVLNVLNSIGFNGMNEFYFQDGLQDFSWIIFGGTLLSLAFNTGIVYYLLKKVPYYN